MKLTNETLIKLTFENSLIYRPSIECMCLIMRVEVVFSICHFVIIRARKSPSPMYLFTTSREAFIRIFTIVLKVARITKNATFK